MKLVLAAVGLRQPAWADAAYEDYARRFPADCVLVLKAVKAEPRTTGKTVEAMMAAEAERLQAAVPRGARRVVLDERGARLTSAQLADRLAFWRGDGRDVAFVVGGPDGLAPEFKATADEALRLSDLTLPHAMVRVLLAEALYRAWSLHTGHPYHRE
ncbi:23S rRNA (pseudouridine(1915)-N(3))-methyltransferase RlmH [Aquabacterium sp. J223]|uniref:23S rRNA (pseudouridine(1915)-N(3))-methyltransferase RlmH n=1 Tax=Aquabacterium sp. J223 TaxID=2898431 RepID=UPI0021AD7888|nr:23S rRNA (pseudouridine(1915)-N(3))-methyltransferase RlmH [Aquabacterium sp. J223]UUX94693.1 23S rRNA (pseudouridine(1915)-N(3))-methyltransferase RlmH [Aquabacterium sp. J223]